MMTIQLENRLFFSRVVSALLATAVVALLLRTGMGPAGGVDGDGSNAGPTTQITETGPMGPKISGPNEATKQDACAKQNSDYVGLGIANVSQRRAAYSGPITFKYFYPFQWGGPFGSFKPLDPLEPDIPARACLETNRGAHPVERASMEGTDSTTGNSIKCQWTAATGANYKRVNGSQEEMILPGGSGTPVPDQPGTCTIKTPDGPARTSNTTVVLTGTLDPRQGAGACPPTPAPVTCEHLYTMKATTVGPVPAEPPPVPAVVTAASLPQGSVDQSVKVTGKEFDRKAGLAFGPGITVNSTTYESITSLSANISVAPDAAVGSRDVTVTNEDGLLGACAACFQVTKGAPAAAPPPAPPAAPPAGPNNQPPLSPGSGSTSGGPPGSNASSGPAGVSSKAPPPSPPGTSGPGGGPSGPGGGTTVAPPSGGGTAPSFVSVNAPTFVPVNVPVHAPVAGLAAEIEQAPESAPQGNAKVMMVGRQANGPPPADASFLAAGLMMLVFCGWRVSRRDLEPHDWVGEAEAVPAVAFAAARQ